MCSNEYRLPNMSDVDPDQLFICPFDQVHRISAKRLPYHIVKCQKNHRTAKVNFCPFNARHIIQVSEFKHHVANCPDRSTIEPDLAYAEAQKDSDDTYMKGDTSVPSYHHDSFPVSTENWDLEATPHERHVQQSEPEKIHTVTGLTTSQKKELNRKLLEVQSNNSRSENFEDDERGESSEPKESEVRLPKQLPKAGGPVQLQHNGMLNPSGQSVLRAPIGLGRALLVPGKQGPLPRQGTTVQGRSIAANIFNTQTTQQQSREETQFRQTPTIATPSARPVIPTASAHSQSNSCSTPTAGPVPNLAGLGRGLGIPRGGYRPGLGMPAAGSYPAVKQ